MMVPSSRKDTIYLSDLDLHEKNKIKKTLVI